jgi:pilus assembly protein CpaE
MLKAGQKMSTVEYTFHNNQSDDLASDVQDTKLDLEHLRPLPRVSIHAFCESEKLLAAMEKCSQDRRMSRTSMRVNRGNATAAASMFANMPTPNLIMLETLADSRNILNELAELAEVCDPSTKVIVIGKHNDILLYRELIRNGVSDYIVGPINEAEIIAAVSKLFVDPAAAPLGRAVAFIGAKGGSGSSTIAHNCSFVISNLFNSEVILADLDLPFGTANIDFDQDPAQGIQEAIMAPDRLDETFLERLLTKCSQRLSLLAAPSLLDRTFDFQTNTFQPLIDTLQRSVPYTILDIPHVWNDWTRNVLSTVDDVVITAEPDLANLRNAKNLYDQLRRLRPNDKPPHLILNKVGMLKRTEISINDFCEPMDISPTAIIPFDITLFGTAANSGRMISEIDSKSPIAETFSQISHIITGRAVHKTVQKPGFDLMKLLKRK